VRCLGKPSSRWSRTLQPIRGPPPALCPAQQQTAGRTAGAGSAPAAPATTSWCSGTSAAARPFLEIESSGPVALLPRAVSLIGRSRKAWTCGTLPPAADPAQVLARQPPISAVSVGAAAPVGAPLARFPRSLELVGTRPGAPLALAGSGRLVVAPARAVASGSWALLIEGSAPRLTLAGLNRAGPGAAANAPGGLGGWSGTGLATTPPANRTAAGPAGPLLPIGVAGRKAQLPRPRPP